MSQSIDILRGMKPHALATQIANLFTSWKAGKQVWEDRVAEVTQYVYATSTRETTNVDNGWSHSTHIPKLTQIHDNLGANYASALFGGSDWFTFEAGTQDETGKGKRKAIEAYLKTKHDWNGFLDVMIQLLNDWVQYGNCFARVEYVREVHVDEDGNEVVDYEGPRVRRISPYNVVMDFEAEDFKHSPVITEHHLSRGDFLRSLEENPDLDYDREVVNQVLEFRRAAADMRASDVNKHIQMRYDGFSTPAQFLSAGTIEILEFVGDIYDEESDELLRNQIITVADRAFVLRSRALGTVDGRKSLFHAGWRLRPDNLWAQGPLDNLIGMQYLIDHLENARADAFDQMLTPDRVFIGNVQKEESGPITNYYIDDAQGDVRNLAPDATVLNADFQIQTKEAQMEAYAGAPREAMGIRSPGEKTAFEVSTLANAAARLFQHKIEYFERHFLEQILNAEVEVAVRNLNVADVIRVMDDDLGVTEFLQITKEDLKARGKLKARGASHFAKRAQKIQELQGLSQALAQDPGMAIHFPGLLRAKAWSDTLDLGEDMYTEFGQIAENMRAQELQSAANRQVDEADAAQGGMDIE